MTARPFTIVRNQKTAVTNSQAVIDQSITHVRKAATRCAQIICIKELFNAPYFCKSLKQEYFSLAEPIPGPTTNALSAVAAELEVVRIAPFYDRPGPGSPRDYAADTDADRPARGVAREIHPPPGQLGQRFAQRLDACILGDVDLLAPRNGTTIRGGDCFVELVVGRIPQVATHSKRGGQCRAPLAAATDPNVAALVSQRRRYKRQPFKSFVKRRTGDTERVSVRT